MRVRKIPSIALRKEYSMKSLIGVFALAFICSGCAEIMKTYSVEHQYDEFDKRTSIYMRNNWLAGYEGLGPISLGFNIAKQTDPSGEKLFVMINFQSDDWLFIREGESLVLLVDGAKLSLSCSQPSRQVLGADNSTKNTFGRGMCAELATYPIERSALYLIAYATEVKVKVIGSEHYIDGAFSQNNFAHLRAFVAQ